MASNFPTIDLSKVEMKTGSTEWESTRKQVFQALQDYGCFIAKYNKVPREAIFNATKEIFEFPTETKLKTTSKKPLHGYIGQFPQLPLYESLGISDLHIPRSVQSIATAFWPDGNPQFINALETYSKPLEELDEMVKRMVLESLGLENYMDDFLSCYFFIIRFTHYKAAQGKILPGLPTHTDPGLVTILSQNSVSGLQLLLKNGEWIDVDLSPDDSFIVISGDSFMAWTNGQLHSPVHRVTMTGDSDRYSIPLFSVPKSGYTIKAPNELVNDQHPSLFKPYDMVELYEYLNTAAAKRASGDAFKAFCGV